MNNTSLTYNEYHTIKEIFQQPIVWLKAYEQISQKKESIELFLSKNEISKDTEIILTGAGTSAYIGNILSNILPLKGYSRVKAIATTDFVTHPELFYDANVKKLMVSFARSGNSPESIAAIEIANRMSKNTAHIIITCNASGSLAHKYQGENYLLLLLPSETNDESLAMTSSFTTMLISFLLLANINKIKEQYKKIETLSFSTKAFLEQYKSSIDNIASLNFKRAVFLGSGELKGIAEECHLKLQELTDGKVICKFDSFLGFRHGPKAVIDKDTLLVYLFSPNNFVRQYEEDLVKQINSNNKVVAQVALSVGKPIKIKGVNYELEIIMEHTAETTGEYAFIPYVLIGQLLGLYKSLHLGLNPDNPSVSGNISRVVEGVTIYSNKPNA